MTGQVARYVVASTSSPYQEHAEPGLTATIAWEDIADALDCPAEPGGGSGGGGGELPITGSTPPLLAGAAVALLAIGAGLYLAGRRRRSQITG